MDKSYIEEGVRERLILFGIAEFEEHGFLDFSLRRVANRAQVSCAAPYRHFKDKEELILAVIRYVRDCWGLLCKEICEVFSDSPERQVVELCVSGVRFWLANGSFRSVLMGGTFDKNEDIRAEMRLFDKPILDALDNYCAVKNLEDKKRSQLTYSVNSLFWGTVMIAAAARSDDAEACINKMKTALAELL